MRKTVHMLLLGTLLLSHLSPTYAQTINEADTDLCDTVKYALINSLRKPIDEAISEIYRDDAEAPEDLTWASYQTEILKVKQLYGVGGTYEITLKVMPYYRAHITYGEDIIVVTDQGKLIGYEHLKTYPKSH